MMFYAGAYARVFTKPSVDSAFLLSTQCVRIVNDRYCVYTLSDLEQIFLALAVPTVSNIYRISSE